MDGWEGTELQQANRLSWNAATAAHNRRKKDQGAFFRGGGSTLFPDELELLGAIEGKSVAHLMCNSGQDSLSLARLGARVTGVDISDEAIAFAKSLSAEAEIGAEFVRSDVYDWLERTASSPERYHVVFISYGALCWLPDLRRFARGVASVLAERGRFVCIDFHPYAAVFSERWDIAYPYGGAAGPIVIDSGVGDYVDQAGEALAPSGRVDDGKAFLNPYPSYEFNWGIGETLQALIDARLEVTRFHEYPYSNGWKPFDEMRLLPGRRWTVAAGTPAIPLMFSVVARKA